MIEKTILDNLKQGLNIPCFFIYPKDDKITEFVIIEKTGSGKNNHLINSTFTFQSYSKSVYDAVVLNEKVKKEVENLIKLNEISKVELNSDYNFTDQERKKHRYQAVFDIYHY